MARTANEYRLAFSGLEEGIHTFDYVLDGQFMDLSAVDMKTADGQAGDTLPYHNPDVKVHVVLHKGERLMELHFDFIGKAFTACDRCLREIAFGVNHHEDIFVKTTSGKDAQPQDDEDVWWITEAESELDLTDYFREVLILSRPMQCFCPEKADGMSGCDPAMLALYAEKGQREEPKADPRWEALRALKDKMDN